MWINGDNYRLTKHGRKRFLERVGQVTDAQMLRVAVHGMKGYRFVWRPDRSGVGYRLVTVIKENRV